MHGEEFLPAKVMERVLSRWWIIFILTVLGGVTGWIFHLVQPPVYEATSILTTSMNFEQLALSEFEEYTAIYAAGAVINSTEVVNTLYSTLQTDGLSPKEISQIQANMSMENRLSTWELHIRISNPEVAAKYANIWAGIAEQKLNEALKHALSGEQLQNEINSLQNCLPSATAVPGVNLITCQSYSLDEINSEIQSWSKDLASEQALSQGILPIMTFSLTSSATIPTKPVLYNQASLVFAGACIGFILSLWIVNIRKVQRID